MRTRINAILIMLACCTVSCWAGPPVQLHVPPNTVSTPTAPFWIAAAVLVTLGLGLFLTRGPRKLTGELMAEKPGVEAYIDQMLEGNGSRLRR